jgi:uncharacterized protein (DUF983 family)
MPFEVMNSHMSDGPREAGPAMKRGFFCRCPACGQGKLFKKYLKTQPVCENCGEELFHEQAHDFPPYITISIVAHVILMGVVMVEQNVEWSMETHMLVWLPLTVILTFLLMQPVKGGVIGYQWARRMHGFGGGDDEIASRKARDERLKDRAA